MTDRVRFLRWMTVES